MDVFLNSSEHPYVKIALPSVDENIKLSCLIDTGFAGGVAIPQRLKNKFNFPLIGERIWELANGSEIELEVFAGEVGFRDKKKEIAVVFTSGEEGMVGIEFLKGMRFVLNLKEKKVELS